MNTDPIYFEEVEAMSFQELVDINISLCSTGQVAKHVITRMCDLTSDPYEYPERQIGISRSGFPVTQVGWQLYHCNGEQTMSLSTALDS